MIGTGIGMLIAGLATAGGQVVGAKMGSNANTKATQLQVDATNKASDATATANQNALDFQKSQASSDYNMAESNRRANFDQWSAKQSYFGSMGDELGLPKRTIPGYVPLPPNPYGTAPGARSAAPGAGGSVAAGGVNHADVESRFNSIFPGSSLSSAQLLAGKDQLAAKGLEPVTNASGVTGKIKDTKSGLIYDVIQAAGAGGTTKQFIVPSTGAAASKAPYTSDQSPFVGTMGDLLQRPEDQQSRNTLRLPQVQYGAPMGAYV